jgi:hypothetical protein
MPTYTITNAHSGTVLGTYEAPNPAAALDAMARDAGYRDYSDLDAQIPAMPGEIVVTEERQHGK